MVTFARSLAWSADDAELGGDAICVATADSPIAPETQLFDPSISITAHGLRIVEQKPAAS
jgi:hypothetical protein